MAQARESRFAPARPAMVRGLAIGGQGPHVGVPEQRERTPHVLQPDPRLPRGSGSRLYGGSARVEVARRRPHLGGAERVRARRSACALDRSGRPRPPGHRQRRVGRRELGPGRDLGIAAPVGRRAALSRFRGHAAPLLRVHGPSGQRQLVRAEFRALRADPLAGLVSGRRRGRVLHAGGPDGPGDRVRRIPERASPARGSARGRLAPHHPPGSG